MRIACHSVRAAGEQRGEAGTQSLPKGQMSVLSPETHTEDRVSAEWERSQAEGRAGPGAWGLDRNQRNASKNRTRHHLTPISLAKI